VAVLTDPERNPAWLARLILETLGGGFRMAVMEALGTVSERHGWYSLEKAAAMKFAGPNIVVLKRNPNLSPAAEDRLWECRTRGLITTRG